MPDLSTAQLRRIGRGHCPDCGHRGFVIGPTALGDKFGNINIECGNLACRSRFNAAFYASAIVTAHRLPSAAEGGMTWASDPINPTPEDRMQ